MESLDVFPLPRTRRFPAHGSTIYWKNRFGVGACIREFLLVIRAPGAGVCRRVVIGAGKKPKVKIRVCRFTIFILNKEIRAMELLRSARTGASAVVSKLHRLPECFQHRIVITFETVSDCNHANTTQRFLREHSQFYRRTLATQHKLTVCAVARPVHILLFFLCVTYLISYKCKP